MRTFVDSLLCHPSIGPMVAHHRTVPGGPARHRVPERPLPEPLRHALAAQGIRELYAHQARALDAARAGRNVLAVTPTASGKTLVFALPVLESILEDPRSRALFLYPTKALAQDQVAGLRALAAATGALRPPRIEIYDGDTSDHHRRKIRADPPEILVTNPDMLHLGILAHHAEWAAFLRDLRFVVIDELHVYRGIFGAHVHHVLRRLRRLCARLGSSPRFIAASATVGNPAEFAATLAGVPFELVDASGAPRAERHVLFVQPVTVSPYTAAVRVVGEAVGAGLRTIAFTKARRVTELLHTWLLQADPELGARVASYRAGYLPEERRKIEARLFRGDLLAVLSTSALELGIDVGGLDVCVLVGYPGSRISSWQRIGRVGREGRDAAVVLIALPDALDQYIVAHPDVFFEGSFEKAVLDPWNPIVAGHHLICAATEEPLRVEEVEAAGLPEIETVRALADEGKLVLDAEGSRWVSLRRRPHRDRSVRGAGEPFSIVDATTGRAVGTVDGMRVYHECHPGAVYLHAGQSFLVRSLDTESRRASVEPARVDYYTVVLGEKETEILERREERRIGEVRVGLGRLRVTVRIRGYQKKRLFGGDPISEHPLSAPPLVFETIGFWIELPAALPAAAAARGLHFMGGIHATEHAMIGLFPLLAISDRGDVGGISYTLHPQVGAPAIFVYDAMPGGAGLAEQGFRDLETLLARTLDLVVACPCESGCPSCIQSPRCGNGNKPLDKEAAELVLRVARGDERVDEEELDATPFPAAEPPPARRRKHGITRSAGPISEEAPPAAALAPSGRVLFFDVETQRSAEEVGGWSNIARMGLALAVVYDAAEDRYRTYFEPDVERLLLDLALADRVVGFNILRFDFEVLSAYTDRDLGRIRSLDLLADLFDRLKFRPSLAHLAEANLGESKSADGLQSLRWWREGRADLVESYCRKDVDLTRRLYDLGRERGYLLFRDRAGRSVRVPVSW
jgi:DEAD/DEAH box helicase domain-containing protein